MTDLVSEDGPKYSFLNYSLSTLSRSPTVINPYNPLTFWEKIPRAGRSQVFEAILETIERETGTAITTLIRKKVSYHDTGSSRRPVPTWECILSIWICRIP